MPIDHKRTSHHIIQSFEADQLKNRSLVILLADSLTSAFGSISFLVFNVILFAFWLVVNTGQIPGIIPFDPAPFILLTMIVSLEAIFLSIIVLMSQNKQSQISTLREELDMQVNLVAEREITMTLKLLKQIADKLAVKVDDPEIEHMTKATDISYIQTQLQTQLTKESHPLRAINTEKIKPILKDLTHSKS